MTTLHCLGRSLVLSAGLLVSAFASADTTHYAGVGIYNGMVNANYELSFDTSAVVVRIGRYLQEANDPALNLSYRHYLNAEKNVSDFFVGAVAGQIESERIYNKDFNRLGAGIEVGYQWVSEFTKITASMGVGAAESVEHTVNVGTAESPSYLTKELEMEPGLMAGVSIALRL